MIRACFEGNYKFDPQITFDFQKYIPDGVSLYYGIGARNINTSGDTNKKIKFEVEVPNSLYHWYNSTYDYENYDLVLLICPYTCNYLNALHNTSKFKPIFFPIENIEIFNEKTIDVFYTGTSIAQLDVYNFTRRSIVRKIGLEKFEELTRTIAVPHIDSYWKKMEILSRTKISIIHNVHVSKSHMINYYKNDLTAQHLPWDKHDNVLPQMKSRMFEGAMMGCILLAYRDEYKTIEKYFKEHEEFIYFDDEAELNAKIDVILSNYEAYKHIGINAQKRVRENYTTKQFIEKACILLDQARASNSQK
jgi:spore maturation protein CgeB